MCFIGPTIQIGVMLGKLSGTKWPSIGLCPKACLIAFPTVSPIQDIINFSFYMFPGQPQLQHYSNPTESCFMASI